MITKYSTAVRIGSLELPNPVMPASGAFGPEMQDVINFNELGALVPKSITKHARPGNQTPRVCETPHGMINSIGIQSKGLAHYIEHTLPEYATYRSPLISSISADSIEEFCEMSEILGNHKDVDALELNISCPNLNGDGHAFGMDAEVTYELMKKVRKVTKAPLLAKLTPNVTSIQNIAVAAEKGGADALTVANTLLAMSVDTETLKPQIGNIMGGLSGPAVKPIIVRMIYQTAQVTSIPIVGCGGVMNGKDALEMMIVGASAVQIGTGSFIHPTALTDVLSDINEYMERKEIKDINQVIGSLRL